MGVTICFVIFIFAHTLDFKSTLAHIAIRPLIVLCCIRVNQGYGTNNILHNMICHALDAVDEVKGDLSPLERVTHWKRGTKQSSVDDDDDSSVTFFAATSSVSQKSFPTSCLSASA